MEKLINLETNRLKKQLKSGHGEVLSNGSLKNNTKQTLNRNGSKRNEILFKINVAVNEE